jgi:hypothetical protein
MDLSFLIAQLFFTGALVGLCWTVQLAVYPLFAPLIDAAGADVFRPYHAAYTRAMGWVAAPLMTVELALAVIWTAMTSDATPVWTGLGLVLAIWLLTFGLIVPAHARIQAQPDVTVARRLTRLNWLRTALWTARAALLAYVVRQSI